MLGPSSPSWPDLRSNGIRCSKGKNVSERQTVLSSPIQIMDSPVIQLEHDTHSNVCIDPPCGNPMSLPWIHLQFPKGAGITVSLTNMMLNVPVQLDHGQWTESWT